MISCVKHIIFLFSFLSALQIDAYANGIDSLTTKENVQKFLITKLSKSGVIYLNQFVGISRTKARTAHDFYYLDRRPYPESYPFAKLAKRMSTYPLLFFKADIDGNGLTDLVVDAGVVIVVMDMGVRVEGHIFSTSLVSNSYGFKNFISLPDGSTGLVFRHDHNPYSATRVNSLPGKITYVTGSTNSGTLSTIKKGRQLLVHSGINTSWQETSATDSILITMDFSDTFDAELYNLTDTLVYKYNGFSNYNSHYKPASISKVCYYFTSSANVGSEGQDCFQIQKNGQCFMKYLGRSGNFSAVADTKTITDLWNLISYVDVKSKKEWYLGSTDHASGGVIAFHFEDGSVKKIAAWACCPVIGLCYVTNYISKITEKLHWQVTGPHTEFECSFEPSPLPDEETDDCECR